MHPVDQWNFMMWELGGDKDPFEYFASKYGRPGAYASGSPYKGTVPDGVKDVSDRVQNVPKNHIWISPAASPSA